jgi:hypothetical protein
MSAVALQNGLYQKLENDAELMAMIVGIYDNPTQVPDPDDNSQFPFITISDAVLTPWDDDHDEGTDATFTVHVWSRASHALEAKAIQDRVKRILHRQKLPILGNLTVGMDYVRSDVQRDADGFTRHGVQDFRIIFVEEDPQLLTALVL